MASATSSPSAEPATGTRLGSSLRLRIAVATAALVLVSILALAFTLFFVFEEQEDQLIDDVVSGQLAHSMAMWREAPERASPNRPDMQLYRIERGTPGTDVPALLRDLPVGNHEVEDGQNEYHVAVRDDGNARFILAADSEEHERRMATISSVLLLSGVLVGVIVLAAVYLLAGRLTRELDQLANRVDSSSAGAAGTSGPSESHLRAGMAREVAAVAGALDRFDARQREAVAREREFTANLSHELRTPLAVIRSDAELLGQITTTDPAALAGVQRRALRIVESVDRITELSASLLTLAREARPQLEEAVGLAALVEQIASTLAARHGTAVPLNLQLPAAATVHGDPALLRLVVSNLLDNALRHAQGQPIDVSLDGSALVVRDRGAGFAEADLGHVFERGWHARAESGMAHGLLTARHAPGHGLGLALVLHACRASGWQARAANAPGGGACLRVDFGAALHPAG